MKPSNRQSCAWLVTVIAGWDNLSSHQKLYHDVPGKDKVLASTLTHTLMKGQSFQSEFEKYKSSLARMSSNLFSRTETKRLLIECWGSAGAGPWSREEIGHSRWVTECERKGGKNIGQRCWMSSVDHYWVLSPSCGEGELRNESACVWGVWRLRTICHGL